jgi:hypothetical protein
MKKLSLLLIAVLFLNSCQFIKLVADSRNHKLVIIKDICLPVDTYTLGTYPIKDKKSTAVGFQEIGDSTIIYARDIEGTINENFKIGDTIKVIVFRHN